MHCHVHLNIRYGAITEAIKSHFTTVNEVTPPCPCIHTEKTSSRRWAIPVIFRRLKRFMKQHEVADLQRRCLIRFVYRPTWNNSVTSFAFYQRLQLLNVENISAKGQCFHYTLQTACTLPSVFQHLQQCIQFRLTVWKNVPKPVTLLFARLINVAGALPVK